MVSRLSYPFHSIYCNLVALSNSGQRGLLGVSVATIVGRLTYPEYSDGDDWSTEYPRRRADVQVIYEQNQGGVL
jgi:hypothetical protein